MDGSVIEFLDYLSNLILANLAHPRQFLEFIHLFDMLFLNPVVVTIVDSLLL
jgi:hypothetical protein